MESVNNVQYDFNAASISVVNSISRRRFVKAVAIDVLAVGKIEETAQYH